ncbi:hypothetical protein [Treponema zioleckii]|uniref:hypothetical protein n=1 Tax=Treponema zioleckii TaxID=331680 RepID=UPI00168B3EA3|nr:hypothetical protein [Treponema zioleckii]
MQTKKFEQSFVNEYLAWNLHDRDVERRSRLEGKIEGKLEANIETARRLKSLGIPLETITQATGLSIDTVKQILG